MSDVYNNGPTPKDEFAYDKARKLGMKAYHSAMQHRDNPYLPVLEDRIPDLFTRTQVPLGVISVPMELIVGSQSAGRVSAFACNFMPILEGDSEFAVKWTHLHHSVVENGVREPVKLVEYMNRYYAVEGNKRISVMKYLGSPLIEADVTRIIPQRTEEKENKVYFEYLDFYADTKINFLIFSQEGSYAKLIKFAGEEAGRRWEDEARAKLKSFFVRFCTEYEVLIGDLLNVTPSDAFLVYLEIFGYNDESFATSTIIRTNIRSMRDELYTRVNGETIAMKLTPDGQKPGILNRLIRALPDKLNVGFINNRSPEVSGWTYWHRLGVNHVEAMYGGKIKTQICSDVAPEDCADTIIKIAEEGANVIFTTSPVLLNGAIKAAVKVPQVKILNCSLLPKYSTVRAYYLRMYEAKFILGAIAGVMTPNDLIGYIADYPVYGTPASINAFAQGAQLTNPNAKVVLEWSTVKGRDPEEEMRKRGVKIICNRDIAAPAHDSNAYGLYIREDEKISNLAMPAWNWGYLYTDLLHRIENGYWETDTDEKAHALNYWWGMDSGAIDVLYTQALPVATRRLVRILRSDMAARTLPVFSDLLRDQSGTVRCGAGQELTPAEIAAMDYLDERVIGEIPELSQMKEEAHAFVELQGIRNTKVPTITGIAKEKE